MNSSGNTTYESDCSQDGLRQAHSAVRMRGTVKNGSHGRLSTSTLNYRKIVETQTRIVTTRSDVEQLEFPELGGFNPAKYF